ncbi:manganese-dependent inorganic pyrophosphatase [Staphylococcus gallinarum]|uniref:Manganese-dependent inorganic pyrophosphatase n=1 Tax=Staphylococcus gallinarum TaxID=1293 RepID=A0A380FIS1_STAGA|nr:manganese-dependent inorganic pyrophosphatase [Staphylococcus gallinarum]
MIYLFLSSLILLTVIQKSLLLVLKKTKLALHLMLNLKNGTAFLPGVVSRKKQVVPQITETLTK